MGWRAVTGLDLQVMGPALVAGLLVLSTHVPLGVIVLNRGIIFIDIALAQVAATGVVFGTMMWGHDISEWVVQASAIGAALACSAFLVWSDRRFPAVQEAIIGVVYVSAAAVQLMMLAANPSGAEYLKKLLIGQILWVTPLQLLGIALVYAMVLALWFFRDLQRERILFYVAFAVVITLSVQIVGVLLVFASLIVPALAARSAPTRLRPMIAFNIGAIGYVTGILVSALFNTPTGATIVCTLVPVAIVSAMIVAAAAKRNATSAPEPEAATDGTLGSAPGE